MHKLHKISPASGEETVQEITHREDLRIEIWHRPQKVKGDHKNNILCSNCCTQFCPGARNNRS